VADNDFSTLFELLPIGAYRSSPDGRQLRANPALVRLDGYDTEAEMLAATQDLAREWYVDPDRRAQFKALLAEHGLVRDFVSEVYRHKTREKIWVRVHAHVVRDASGAVSYYEGTVEDITQQRRAQLETEANERRFRALTERAPVLTVICGEHGELSYVSSASISMLGVPGDAMIGRSLFEWVHADDLAQARAEHERVLAFDRGPAESIHRYAHADGSWRYLAAVASNGLADDAVGGVVMHFRDVTQEHVAKQELIASEARFRRLTELSSDWYWEVDSQFRIVRMETGKRSFNSVLTSSPIGKTRQEVAGVPADDPVWAAHQAVLESHQPFHDFETQRVAPDGSVYWHTVSGTPMFDGQGGFLGYCGVGRDVTDRMRAQEAIRQLAFHDVLTGLPNRRLLMDRIQQALVASTRSQQTGALLFLDLDNFKTLNDAFGHDVGDALLQQVAGRLAVCVRASDTVARLGGDEFVVLLQNEGDSAQAATAQAGRIALKILQSLREPYDIGPCRHQCSISIGAVVLDDPLRSPHDYLRMADLAMYQAKASGRNTLCFYAQD
jgi:diguanylate cyclase (GGDEF)-like protein/PAS domain S-box-containing protein